MKPVGYLLNTEQGLVGERGACYDYIVGGNGLFLRAQNKVITATLCISVAQVRGLRPVAEEVSLLWGKIPQDLYYQAVAFFASDPGCERYLAIVHNNEYQLVFPFQEGGPCGVTYECVEGRVVDIHSHSRMKSFFSGTDNSDELGFAVYAVIGEVDRLIPSSRFRLGVYGYFKRLKFEEVFDV